MYIPSTRKILGSAITTGTNNTIKNSSPIGLLIVMQV